MKKQYSLAYTAGAALLRDSIIIASIKINSVNWNDVKKQVIEENTLQARTLSTLMRMYSEIYKRLSHLNTNELKHLVSGNEEEQKQLIWIAICRQYKIIRDFAVEVLVLNFNSGNYLLTHHDYDVFFNMKCEWDESLDNTSELTKYKARQVLFKMLRECSLVNEKKEILNQNISPYLQGLLDENSHTDLKFFPITRIY